MGDKLVARWSGIQSGKFPPLAGTPSGSRWPLLAEAIPIDPSDPLRQPWAFPEEPGVNRTFDLTSPPVSLVSSHPIPSGYARSGAPCFLRALGQGGIWWEGCRKPNHYLKPEYDVP